MSLLSMQLQEWSLAQGRDEGRWGDYFIFQQPKEPLTVFASIKLGLSAIRWELFNPGEESTQAQLSVPWFVLFSPESAKCWNLVRQDLKVLGLFLIHQNSGAQTRFPHQTDQCLKGLEGLSLSLAQCVGRHTIGRRRTLYEEADSEGRWVASLKKQLPCAVLQTLCQLTVLGDFFWDSCRYEGASGRSFLRDMAHKCLFPQKHICSDALQSYLVSISSYSH